jgi:hypothetical protein
VFVTEYLLNSLLYTLSKEGKLHFGIENNTSITTNLMLVLIGTQILKHGFNRDMPCNLYIATVDPPLSIELTTDMDEVEAAITLDIMC